MANGSRKTACQREGRYVRITTQEPDKAKKIANGNALLSPDCDMSPKRDSANKSFFCKTFLLQCLNTVAQT